ncbi:uncharacterized protein LOC106086726 [Stomoxys calcitrans]|uniref:Attacin C-terminal domain-containing protein n=1 Tax=Stomoxys calcitrans TaxID=35570 RepID=A0A1I8PJG2_STOCA|nr:uncharacterized protein LOC106086726 [Stomoxys calcitrans]
MKIFPGIEILVLFLMLAAVIQVKATPVQKSLSIDTIREKRQIDLRISAEHDDDVDETELALEAIANLYRSPDGKTQIDGTAKVMHRSNSLQNGPGTDWRLGVQIQFT